MPDKNKLPETTNARTLPQIIESDYVVADLDTEEDFSITRALTAETATEILASPESVPLDEITGEPFKLLGIDFFAKTMIKDSSSPYYVYLNCEDQNGVRFSATTGSAYTMARVVGLDQRGLLPRWVMAVLVESKKKAGQSSLWIVDPKRGIGSDDVRVVETTAEAQIS